MTRRRRYPDEWFTGPVRAWFGAHWRPAIEWSGLDPKVELMLQSRRKARAPTPCIRNLTWERRRTP